MIGLKARLEQETSAADGHNSTSKQQDLAQIEECLASGDGGSCSSVGAGAGWGEGKEGSSAGLDTTSIASDTAPGAEVVWAGGACGALVYESVDELRVAVDSLQVLTSQYAAFSAGAGARSWGLQCRPTGGGVHFLTNAFYDNEVALSGYSCVLNDGSSLTPEKKRRNATFFQYAAFLLLFFCMLWGKVGSSSCPFG